MPLAYVWIMQCESRPSSWVVCLVLAALEISGIVWESNQPHGPVGELLLRDLPELCAL